MSGGWVGKILTIDLTSGDISFRDIQPYLPDCLGGRGLAAQIAWEELPAGIDAFDPANLVIIATGPLTGTLSPTGGRTIMTSLSPRVYPNPWHTHSTLGGWFGPALKYAGFDAIIIRGKAENPVFLEILDDQVSIKDARDLWGLDTRQTQLILKGRNNSQTQIMAIGPAGENLVRFATVEHAEENAAGHSGFGAVWGSKNMKAIAVYGTGSVPVASPKRLLEEVFGFGTFKVVPIEGYILPTSPKQKRPVCSQACTFNCVVSSYEETVEGRRVPGQCVGGFLMAILSNANNLKVTYYKGGGVEVPAGRSFGLCEEITLKEGCDRLGLDLWHRLVMQPWLIACVEHGIHEIRGYPILPKDVFWYDQFQKQLAYREGLGAILAEDLLRAMDELEGELPAELLRLGREMEFAFGFPAHREGRFWDEEPLPFWVISAMMYASESRDPSIGTHQSSLMLAELLLEDQVIARKQFRHLSEKTWGYAEALEPTFENKAPVAIWSQNQHMLIDSLPLCDFAFPQVVRPFESKTDWQNTEDITGDLDFGRRLLVAVTGLNFTNEDLTRMAERAFTLERLMLARAGRTRSLEEALAPHFKLPCRADGTLIEDGGFSCLLDEYYAARNWDVETGLPSPENLATLGLEEAIPELRQLLSIYKRQRA
jgi:aldehyde:ferredoxin oxidoreductase